MTGSDHPDRRRARRRLDHLPTVFDPKSPPDRTDPGAMPAASDNLDHAGRALWLRSVGDATPLATGRRIVRASAARTPLPDPARRMPEAAPSHGGAGSPPVALAARGQGTPGLDAGTAERMRRGELPLDGRIDLHGLTAETASRRLASFLAGMEAQGARCVLVITGKGIARGDPSDGFDTTRAGVLRRSLPGWLAEGAHAGRIVAYAPSAPRHGGDGAFYVLLRRRRDR